MHNEVCPWINIITKILMKGVVNCPIKHIEGWYWNMVNLLINTTIIILQAWFDLYGW